MGSKYTGIMSLIRKQPELKEFLRPGQPGQPKLGWFVKATICNKEWKPLQPHMTNDEAVHEHIANKLNKPTDETIEAFEQSLKSLKEKKRIAEIPEVQGGL